ncbi:unnamed protein product [Spirodela intermedia]|uniref:Uncharacterized protein n=1 Tax=Spirodela intermedia TaxID=51605 RepID=A0A7I8JXH0_SPIIN|nr:unnamed protein product [Spirodela intermedia]
MGQVLRGAAGKVRASKVQQQGQHLKNTGRRPPGPPAEAPYAPKAGQNGLGGVLGTDDSSGDKTIPGVLEERDPTYDAMLGKMVGRITTKPGGKLEMGEAFIVEKYNRPMPKLRSSKAAAAAAAGGSEEKPLPSGTLEAAQLRQIILLHEGKSEDHRGPMSIEAIAEKFRIDVATVQNILRFVSLPPEDGAKKSEPTS